MGLARTEQELTNQLGEEASMFMRVGKRFIVNRNFIYCVNLAKLHLVLSDMDAFAFQLPISKDALKKMKELVILANQ